MDIQREFPMMHKAMIDYILAGILTLIIAIAAFKLGCAVEHMKWSKRTQEVNRINAQYRPAADR